MKPSTTWYGRLFGTAAFTVGATGVLIAIPIAFDLWTDWRWAKEVRKREAEALNPSQTAPTAPAPAPPTPPVNVPAKKVVRMSERPGFDDDDRLAEWYDHSRWSPAAQCAAFSIVSFACARGRFARARLHPTYCGQSAHTSIGAAQSLAGAALAVRSLDHAYAGYLQYGMQPNQARTIRLKHGQSWLRRAPFQYAVDPLPHFKLWPERPLLQSASPADANDFDPAGGKRYRPN